MSYNDLASKHTEVMKAARCTSLPDLPAALAKWEDKMAELDRDAGAAGYRPGEYSVPVVPNLG